MSLSFTKEGIASKKLELEGQITILSKTGKTFNDKSRLNYLRRYLEIVNDGIESGKPEIDVLRELEKQIASPGGPQLDKALEMIEKKRSMKDVQKVMDHQFQAGILAKSKNVNN